MVLAVRALAGTEPDHGHVPGMPGRLAAGTTTAAGTVSTFRAGGTASPAGLTILRSSGQVLLADISEFQSDLNDAAYLAWSPAVVIRAMYGDQHVDAAWYGGARRAALHAGGAQFIGIYAYLVAGQDAAAQARALVQLLGPLQPGELPICDLEEGSGNQAGRWNAWASVIHGAYGITPWLYSGQNFAQNAGLAPQWVADYGAAPSMAHLLWQFTDAYTVPGVGVADCSVFNGTIAQLAQYAQGGTPPAAAPSWQETMMNTLPTLQQGARDAGGSPLDVHRVQVLVAGIGRWNNLGTITAVTDDGSFGPSTTAAVKRVQQFFGLTADGIVGPASWKALVTGAA